jgi:hypothetical protein
MRAIIGLLSADHSGDVCWLIVSGGVELDGGHAAVASEDEGEWARLAAGLLASHGWRVVSPWISDGPEASAEVKRMPRRVERFHVRELRGEADAHGDEAMSALASAALAYPLGERAYYLCAAVIADTWAESES